MLGLRTVVYMVEDLKKQKNGIPKHSMQNHIVIQPYYVGFK